MKISIAPASVIDLMKRANENGQPHHFVQIDVNRAATVLSWSVDDSRMDVEITITPDGRWTATMEVA